MSVVSKGLYSAFVVTRGYVPNVASVIIPGYILVTDVRYNAVFLQATPPTGNVGTVSYSWYRSTSPGFTANGASLIYGANSPTYIDFNVQPNTTYYYKAGYTDVVLNFSTTAEKSATTLAFRVYDNSKPDLNPLLKVMQNGPLVPKSDV